MSADSSVEQTPQVVRVASLVGLAEVAQRLGVSRTQVNTWETRRARNGFPPRVATLACGPIWDWEEIERWHRGYVPSKGGAPLGNRNQSAKRVVQSPNGKWHNVS